MSDDVVSVDQESRETKIPPSAKLPTCPVSRPLKCPAKSTFKRLILWTQLCQHLLAMLQPCPRQPQEHRQKKGTCHPSTPPPLTIRTSQVHSPKFFGCVLFPNARQIPPRCMAACLTSKRSLTSWLQYGVCIKQEEKSKVSDTSISVWGWICS
jgi:hypothetical protein